MAMPMKRTDIYDIGEEEIVTASSKSKGLGDTVAKVTRAVGIKPCGGCKKRQKRLNEIFPYRDIEVK
jgi:hypothetical protein